jgi:hypothetical protein
MRDFIEQTTSESERSYPVVPNEQASERSIPSVRSIAGRGEGGIVYSHGHYETSYSLRVSRTRKGRKI